MTDYQFAGCSNCFYRPLSILFVCPLPKEVGGSQAGGIATHCWHLARNAHKAGNKVTVLANTADSFIADGINVVSDNSNNRVRAFCGALFYFVKNKLRFDDDQESAFSVWKKIRRADSINVINSIIRECKPDVVHIHSLHNPHLQAWSLIQPRVPLIITDHGFWQVKDFERKIVSIKKWIQFANAIICVSSYSKHMIEHYKIGERIPKHVLFNPIDVENIAKYDIPSELDRFLRQGKKIVAFAGVTHPFAIKNLGLVLQAFRDCDRLRNNCALVIVTTPKEGRKASCMAKKYNIDCVVFPPLSNSQLMNIFSSSNVLAVPSKSESFGMVYLEALKCGIRPIGFWSSIRDINNSLGFEAGIEFNCEESDTNVLAGKIISALDNPISKEKLHDAISRNFSWDVCYGKYENVYRSACGGVSQS